MAQAVRITLLNIRGVQSSSYTDNQGQFEIASLNPGEYTLEAEGDRLVFEISAEKVEVRKGSPTVVSIILREKSTSAAGKPVGKVVSVGEIQEVPAKARQEFERASKFAKTGNSNKAIYHLQKAIDIYPNFLMARNDLGAQLLELGRLEEAEQQLRAALAIDAQAYNPNLNLGIVLFKKHSFSDARFALDKAISLQPELPEARLYSALTLMALGESQPAEKHLVAAYNLGGKPYAIALFHLGQIFMDRGARDQARSYFERYVQEAPAADNIQSVRKLIALLQ